MRSENYGSELKVMFYELPPALADGKIADKIIGFSRISKIY